MTKNMIKAKKLAVKFNKELTAILSQALTGKSKIIDNESCKYKFLYVFDYAQLIRYCDLIIKGKFDKALLMQQEMDTETYESIPNELYNIIMNMTEDLK